MDAALAMTGSACRHYGPRSEHLGEDLWLLLEVRSLGVRRGLGLADHFEVSRGVALGTGGVLMSRGHQVFRFHGRDTGSPFKTKIKP